MKTARIVLVEDNPADVFLIKKALQERGIEFDLTCFEDGQKALESFSRKGRNEPDLILLDLNLPKMDGIEVLRAIRDMPRLASVPVVILTSSESPKDKNRITLLGASRYIMKPSRLEDFLRDVGSGVEEILAT